MPSTAIHEGDIEAVTVEEEGVMDQAMRYYERAVEAVQEAVEDFDREEATEEVKRLYEQAREAGEEVPEDVYSWVREDYGRMFAWEYTVLELGHEELGEAAEKMNLLGAERWECIAVVAREGRARNVFQEASEELPSTGAVARPSATCFPEMGSRGSGCFMVYGFTGLGYE